MSKWGFKALPGNALRNARFALLILRGCAHSLDSPPIQKDRGPPVWNNALFHIVHADRFKTPRRISLPHGRQKSPETSII